MLEELFDKSRSFFLAGDLRRSREMLDRILPLLNTLPENPASRILKTRYHNNLASIYQRTLDYTQARKHYLLAQDIINGMNRPRHDHLAMVLNNLGMLESQAENLTKAEEYLKLSEEIAVNVKDRRKKEDLMRGTSFNRARLLMKMQRLDEAREEVARMNQRGRVKVGDGDGVEARNFEASGSLLHALARESEAAQSPDYLEFQNWSISHFRHAKELYGKLNDPYKKMRASLNAVSVDLEAGRCYQELLEDLSEIEEYAEEIESPLLSGMVIEKRVHYFINAEDMQLALSEIERCLDLLHEIPVSVRLKILGKLRDHAGTLEQNALESRLDKYIQTLIDGEESEQLQSRN